MNNYILLKEEYIDDIKSHCFLYKHNSGAKIVCVENEDANRVFSLSFGTKPMDNTGVFHILEHSVLCGSKKYPVHDPFNDLDKGSINTYLNAITFYDKTVYPVASTNEKDFFNLINVYCDAVFNPLIEEKKGIFLQEGVNFDGEKINGVVYNEMKGVFAEPQEILGLSIKEKLYKDNGYCYYSGGVPKNIPELTYEDFIKTYKKYYMPSNCLIYIYGKLNFENYLEFLHKEYLSKYENKSIKEKYEEITPFDEIKSVEMNYNGDDSHLQVVFALGNAKNVKEMKALEVLGAVLMDTEISPIYKALEEAELGDNIEYFIDDNMYQPSFNISISGSEEKNILKFKKVLEDTFKQLYEKGIEKRLIEGAVKNQLFYIKEEDFGYKPKGLFYNMELISYFIYGKEDFEGLKFGELFDENYDYMSLIKKYFIDNKSVVYGILKNGKNSSNCTEETNAKIEKNIEELEKYQRTEDLPQDKAKIPCINVREISLKTEKINTEIHINNNIKCIYNPIKKDIIYFTMLFDTSHIPYRLKKYINIYSYLAGKIDTKNYSASEIDMDINYYLGGLDVFYSSFFTQNGFLPMVVFEGKALEERTDKLLELMCEVVENTVFKDEVKITRLLKELKSRYEQNFIYSGNKRAVLRGAAKISSKYLYDEFVEGIEFYIELCKIIKKLEKSPKEVLNEIEEMKKYLINNKNIYISIVAQNKAMKKAEDLFNNFSKRIDDAEFTEKYKDIPNLACKNERFLINGDISFNAKCWSYEPKDCKFGHIQLLNKIVTSDYLWKKVRGEGGAYGSSSKIDRFGTVSLSSFRDNNIDKTYDLFDNIYDYIVNMKIDEKSLEKYKIGTFSDISKPIKNTERAFISLSRHFAGISCENLDYERECIANANINDIKENAYIFDNKNSVLCTVCGDIFEDKKRLFHISTKI